MHAVWNGRSDGFRNEAGSWVWGSVHGKGYFLGRMWAPNCNKWVVCGVVAIFPNHCGITCYSYCQSEVPSDNKNYKNINMQDAVNYTC